ncbi:helix-turn-helix transcriptional regulator [Clostridium algidicarnis]|uniref:helix-turn-helix transcriptional regulator n=1 Tax=Clostridium algidicarnis TaxID=37659 RepID=UPI0006898CDA|nr:transcriptional regulator [Clostridium algidicarnis]MBB6697560.1 transcriptional regulator [Clostridium algidicarnis]MBU3203352.1 transcriptional regulator [Clostridium algidicarnis]MBU3211506.1 transcriptional regulator [Clostridium algidicarnis]MBU3221986.1 transcriptional regulator [Clostridium algidicarnis]
MSKVGNALKMLILLKSRGKMKISELSRELEVNERQIIRYKESLEQAGIYITSIPGRYGGYIVEGKDYLLGLNLTDKEYNSLIMAQNQLKYEEFLFYEDFKMIIEKINAVKEKQFENDFQTDYFIKGIKSNFDYEKEYKAWLDIHAAIIMNKKIKVMYASLKNEIKERVVRPYGIFQYKGSLYFVAFCEYRKEIRQFKILRIKKYETLDERFQKDENFNIREYMKNSIGIFKDGEVNLKLKVYYPYAQIVKEKLWVEDQKITDFKDSNYIIFQAKMNGLTEIKSWILSMGSDVEVIEPSDFKEQIKKEVQKVMKLYNL